MAPIPGTSRPLSRRLLWRMRILVGVIVLAVVGAAMAGWLIARTSSPPSGPVILVSIDGLRPDRLGAYGSRRALTPNIDALAASGVVFERAYAHSPLTTPSHVTMLSGRLPFETSVRDDEGATLPPKMPLLPALLHRRGFKTAGIVSSALLGSQTGLGAAFDFYDAELGMRAPSTPLASASRDGAATMEVAKRWIDQQGTRFFLFLHLDEPRAPYAPPARLATAQPYDGEVRRADELVGALVQHLRQRGLYDRSIIVLTSDHGEALGEHGEAEHGLFLHDSTLRTPLIVKMPKNEAAGRRRAEVVQHIDILPTVLDLMGAPRPSSLRGRSLRHLIGSEDATLATAAVYAETLYPRLHLGWSDLASVTDGRYRFIRAPRPELYDLLQDRDEHENIAAANPAKLAELSAALERYLAAAPAPAASPLTDEDRQALVALAEGIPAKPNPARAGELNPAKVTPRSGEAGGGPLRGPVEAGGGRPGASVGAGEEPQPPGKEAEPAKVLADPKDGIALLHRLGAARALTSVHRLSEAIAAYREVVAMDPGMPDAWSELGTVLLAAGQAKDALDAFRHAMRLMPEDGAAILAAARCLMKLGKLDEAEQHALLAAKLSPANANELLVRIELRQKDYPGAQRAAAAARQADPASPMPAFAGGVELYQAGKYEEALALLESAVQQAAARPVQTPDVCFYAGETLAHLRKYSDAEARLTEELRWFPENLRARESLATVYQATGRTAELQTLVTDLLRAAPTPEGYAVACRLSTAAGDKAGAANLRAEGRQRFGEAAVRAAETGPRQ